MSLYGRIKAAYQAFRGEPPFSGVGGQGFWNDYNIGQLERLLRFFTGSRIDYEREVGDLSLSSLVMAAANWLGTTLPEAPLQVTNGGKGKKAEVIEDHDLPKLWSRPNPYYSGELLWKAFGVSWFISGNVYFLKVRDRTGQVVEIWYLPHWMVAPQWPVSGTPFISHYLYCVDGLDYRLEREDLIHFRWGLDPNNPRLGMAPSAPVMRELYSDHEAANFAAQLLHNFGVPGVIISPKGEHRTISKEDRELIKQDYQRKFVGDGRGSPMVLSGGVEVSTLSMDPAKLLWLDQRKISEARWAAVTGIPAAVLGFSSGMEQTKVGATMRELREQAYESFLIPTQRLICGDLNVQLLPEFEAKGSQRRIRFDNSEVRVLQEDHDKMFARINRAWVSDELTLDETREAIGYPPDTTERGALYYSQVKALSAPKPEPGTEEEDKPPQLVNGKTSMEGLN